MRQLQYTRPGLALVDQAEPQIVSPTEVKVRVAYASLCGTDLHILRGDFDDLLGSEGSSPLGHEAAGTVVEVGTDATSKGLRVGDRVTFYFNRYCGSCHYCRAGKEQFCTAVVATMSFMSDLVVLDEQQVFPLPETIGLSEAALLEPVTVALRGVDLAGIRPGSTVAVSGGGGIGQIVSSLARLSGATSLTMIEPIADKRELALRRGAVHAIDPLTEDVEQRADAITNGLGFDVVIEASGAPQACQSAMRIAGRGARVEFLATYSPAYTFELPMGDAFLREITLVTGVYQSPYLFPRAIALAGSLALEELVTVFLPEEFEAGFAAQREGKSVKTVFEFTHLEGENHG